MNRTFDLLSSSFESIFICYTEDQRNHLLFFLSQKSKYPIVGRSVQESTDRPLFIGPVFIHRDATFEAYNYFFAIVKASLYSNKLIRSFDLRLGEDMYIGVTKNKRW